MQPKQRRDGLKILKEILSRRALVLIVILLLAAYFRVTGLHDQGLVFHDESFISSRAALLKTHHFSISANHEWTDFYVDSKILWIYLVILADYLFFGHFLSVHFLSTAFALLAVLLTYLFAKRLCRSTTIGLLSAFFLAVLPSHVFYSRTTLPETAAGAVGIATLLFYLHGLKSGRIRYFIYAGILTGMAFMLNRYRVVGLPFFCLILWFYFRRNAPALAFNRITGFLVYAGSALVPLLGYPLICVLAGRYGLYLPAYWAAVKTSLATHSLPAMHLTALWEYLYFIFIFEGWGVGLLFLAGFFFIRSRRSTWRPLSFVVFQLIIGSFVDERVPRNLSFVYPYLAMGLGIASYHVVRFFRLRQRVPGLVFLLIPAVIGPTLYRSYDIHRHRYSLAEPLRWLSDQGPENDFVSTNPAASVFSSKGVMIYAWARIPYSLEFIKRFGFEYILVDPGTYIVYSYNNKYGWNDYYHNFIEEISRCRPLQVFERVHPMQLRRMIFEANRDFPLSQKMLKEIQQGKDRVIVYGVDACLQEKNRRE